MPAFDPNAPAPAESGIFGLPFTPDEAEVVLIPVPFEVTTSYGGGTSNGPQAVLNASKQVDLFDLDTGRPYEGGIAMLEESTQVRAWNDEGKRLAQQIIETGGLNADHAALTTVNLLCERMNTWVYETAKQWLAKGKKVGLVGGDHSTPFGLIRATAEKYPGMGVLHLDAHADLRDAYEGFTWSHASIMFNVVTRIPQVGKVVQVGIRDFGEAEFNMSRGSEGRIRTFFDAELKRGLDGGASWKSLCDQIVKELPNKVYLSWDIDGLEPTLCPHTGTPVPGGLTFSQACALLEALHRAGKQIIGFDLNEVAPGPEGDEWDGNVGARLLYKMIGWSKKK